MAYNEENKHKSQGLKGRAPLGLATVLIVVMLISPMGLIQAAGPDDYSRPCCKSLLTASDT
jgi:hypothetical protein